MFGRLSLVFLAASTKPRLRDKAPLALAELLVGQTRLHGGNRLEWSFVHPMDTLFLQQL